MMEVKSIDRDGEILVMKGKMMGSMNTIIHIRPEDTWLALRMMSVKVVLYLPVMLFRGFWRTWRGGKQ